MTRHRLVSLFLLPGLLLVPAAFPAGAAGGTLTGRVTDSAGLILHVVDQRGRPIALATVHAGLEIDEDEAPEKAGWREKTTAGGMARLPDLPADERVWLLIEKKGFLPEVLDVRLQTGEPRAMKVVLRPGGVSAGRVVDEKGKPVAGVEVELSGGLFGLEPMDLPAFLRDKARRRTRTGPAGRFRFHDLQEGEFLLGFKHPSYVPLAADHPVQGGRRGNLGRFVLRRGEALTGTVTDPEGRPIAGVPLWAVTAVTKQEGKLSPSATTGPDGSFVIPNLPPGTLELYACGRGHLQDKRTVWFLDEPLQLTLEPAATLGGRVLGPDGEPLAGARLSASQPGVMGSCVSVWTPCPDTSAISDAEGRFVVGPLGAGWYDLFAQADGMQQGTLRMLRVSASETVEGREIRVQTGGVLTGRVLDTAGAPVARAVVFLTTDENYEKVAAAADGSYRFSGVGPGSGTLDVEACGYTILHKDLEPIAGEARIDLILEPEPDPSRNCKPLKGRVVGPDGAPIERAIVRQLSGEQTLSAADGSFELQPPDQPTKITATRPGFVEGQIRVDPAAHPTPPLEIRLQRAAPEAKPEQAGGPADHETPVIYTVSGRVLDELAQPVGGVEISAWDRDLVSEPAAATSGTRSDGSFALRLPDGRFSILIHKKGFPKKFLPFQVTGEPVTDLEIRLEPGKVLRGRLLGLAPGEVPEIVANGPGGERGEVEIDSYSISDLEAGVWTIKAILSEDFARWRVLHRTVEIPPEASEVEMDLDFAEAEERLPP